MSARGRESLLGLATLMAAIAGGSIYYFVDAAQRGPEQAIRAIPVFAGEIFVTVVLGIVLLFAADPTPHRPLCGRLHRCPWHGLQRWLE